MSRKEQPWQVNSLLNAPWKIKELGNGISVRYQRTLAESLDFDWGGTAGYRFGVDFHFQVHCEMCCCAPTEVFGCTSPAAGIFTVSSRNGIQNLHFDWANANAAFHLADPVRHPVSNSSSN